MSRGANHGSAHNDHKLGACPEVATGAVHVHDYSKKKKKKKEVIITITTTPTVTILMHFTCKLQVYKMSES